ncbi:MAG: efflux RND transporter periplasmic adaptor subunit [Rikenellaceae bacterium]|nr:efflux RND transporter periplasmic adaptor subunit [Rikenellaceae bacterium]
MKKRDFLKIPLQASVVAMVYSCGGSNQQEDIAEEKTMVTVEAVYRQDVEQSRTFTGTVEANVKNNITPHTSVRIDKIFVEVGDRVQRGQRLVTMDTISLQQAKFQMENDSLEYIRTKELHEFGGASRSELDARKLDYDISLSEYRNLTTNTELLSPVSGVVTARNYDNGDMYSGGDPVLTVEQIKPVKILINVSESLYTKVTKDMEVSVQLDVYGEEEFTGKVNLIYPTIDANTRTFPVEVIIANPDERIRPGMFSRVTLAYGTENRVVIPDRAVVKQTGSGDRYVYVVEPDSTVTFKKVELGRRMDDLFEIVSGVDDGDIVIVTGQSRVTNGAAVEIVKQEERL